MVAQLVLNEHSRRGRESADAVRSALHDAGIAFREDADARGGPSDCIIGAGGDGTIIGCVATAVERKVPLGIIPLGTFNELARTLAIPVDIEGAVRVIAAGNERTIDVGTVNGKYFVNEASIGISSRISRMQTPELKQRFGFLGVIATAFQAFRHSKPFHAEVTFDGKCERLRTIQLTIANSHRFGGLLEVEDAAIDDGLFDLYSVDIRNFWEAFSIARAAFAGKPRDVPGLRRFQAQSFDVRTHRAHRIAADAEPAGVTPAVFKLQRRALRVFAAEGA